MAKQGNESPQKPEKADLSKDVVKPIPGNKRESDPHLPTDRPVQKNKKRCWTCRVKLELVQQEVGKCRCGEVFISSHCVTVVLCQPPPLLVIVTVVLCPPPPLLVIVTVVLCPPPPLLVIVTVVLCPPFPLLGYVFCVVHRLPEQHSCIYNHKESGRQEALGKMVQPKKHLGRSFHRLDSQPE